MKDFGRVHAVYGNGKGKTTSAIGTMIRTLGIGGNVGLIQFMKSGDSSEVGLLNKMGETHFHYFCPGKHDFITQNKNSSQNQKLHAYACLEKAYEMSRSDNLNLLVCDEILGAVHFGLINIEDVIGLIENKRNNLELFLTGCSLPNQLLDKVDYCTQISAIKHPYQEEGLQARSGIEY